MKKQDTTNTFNEGLMMDLNPLVTPNNVVTNCLNGTLTTYNGNENVLQNDMGNGRVETAFLPEGYVPIGTTELGGIIYIISYNPFTGKNQIGSFPSPERNITVDEISPFRDVTFRETDFKEEENITTPVVKKQLSDIILHPGDKFLVAGESIMNNIDHISSYDENDNFVHKYIDFRIATIDDNGKLLYLDDLNKYLIQIPKKDEEGNEIKDVYNKYYTHIQNGGVTSESGTDLDEYRKLIGSNYSIFTSKTAGNLYVVGQLEVIDSISSLTWELENILDKEPENAKNVVDYAGEGKEYKCYQIKYTITTESERGNLVDWLEVSDLESLIQNDPKQQSFEFIVNYKIPIENDKVTIPAKTITVTPCMEFGRLKYLQEKLTIDFSLLGSNQIQNNVWKYYSDENGVTIRFDLENYYLKNNIKIVQLQFDDLLTKKENILTIDLTQQKTYTGLQTVNIPFKEIEKNSLYRVTICITLNEGNPINKKHYMYTDGVFNDYFFDQSEDSDNFDNISLPLNPVLKFKNISTNINLISKNNLISGKFTYARDESPEEYIRGETIYTKSGQSEKVETDLNFNNSSTFSLAVDNITIKKGQDDPTITNNITQQNVSIDNDTDIDQDYIVESNVKASFDGKNHAIITYNEETNRFNYDIELRSIISSSIQKREVEVSNYFAPVLNTIDDAIKYGLVIMIDVDPDQGEYVRNPVFNNDCPALAMSAGGADNTGSGGLYYVAGTGSVEINTIEGSNPLVVTGNADSSILDSGNKGIKVFPNENMSNILYKNNSKMGLVPVLLLDAGTYYFKINGGGLRKGYIGNYTQRSKEDHARKGWFEEEHLCDYAYFMLFARLKGSDDFAPLNQFIKITRESDTLKFQNIQKYYSLLANLYAKRPFEDKVEIYTVGNISYLTNKVVVTVPLKANFNYTQNSLFYQGKSIVELAGEDYDKYKCFNIDFKTIDQDTMESTTEAIFTLNVDQQYLDTYVEYQQSNTIPNYVKNGRIIPPDIVSGNGVYVIGNLGADQKLVLVSSLTDYTLPLVWFTLESDGEIYNSLSTNSDSTSEYTYSNLNMLSYDSREDYLCVDKRYLNTALSLCWGSKDNTLGLTQMCNKGFDKECDVTKIPEHDA